MSQGTDPVLPTEYVLRRVHKSRCSNSGAMPMLPQGFCPNDQDTTGISVYREKLTTVAAVVAAARKPDEVYVARISVQALLDLGLTLVPDDDPDGPAGHMVIPQLSRSAYETDKVASKDVQVELARIASTRIVHRPPGS